jgi:hypothetical protein
MPNAQIVGSFVENGQACLALQVDEGTAKAPRFVEYVGRIPLPEDWAEMDGPRRDRWVDAARPALVAAAAAVRDASVPAAPADLGLSGVVSL